MADQEIEVEVRPVDKATGKPGDPETIKIVKKQGKNEGELGGKTVEKLKKNNPKKPPDVPKPEPLKVTGFYDGSFGVSDRDITFIIDCTTTPPTLEVIVVFAEGDDKGKRDEPRCKKYALSPQACGKLRTFVEGLDLPLLTALAPAAQDEYAVAWDAPALYNLGRALEVSGQAILSATPEWQIDGAEATLVAAIPGSRIVVEHLPDGLEARISIAAESQPVRIEEREPTQTPRDRTAAAR